MAVDAAQLELADLGHKRTYEKNETSFEKEHLYEMFPNRMRLLSVLGGVEGVADELGADTVSGLSRDEIEGRRERWGSNERRVRPQTLLHYTIAAMTDFSLILLILVAVVSVSLGVSINEFAADTGGAGYVEGVSILAAVFIIVSFTVANEYTKDLRFSRLSSRMQNQQVVLKRAEAAERMEMNASEVVVGDVMFVFRGSIVPADGLLLGDPCKVNELHVTGDADDVRKSAADPFIMAGSHVTEGFARVLVTGVGDFTYLAIKAKKHHDLKGSPGEESLTPLQLSLAKLAKNVGKLGFAVSIVLFFVLAGKYLITKVVKADEVTNEAIERMTEYALVALTLIVVSVPEGLPFSVTLAIAFSVNRMVEENNMCRTLGAIETMGRASEVLIDLTGAVTMNRMVVDQLFVGGEQYAIPDVDSFDYGRVESRLRRATPGSSGKRSEATESLLAKVLHAMFINSTARLLAPNEGVLEEDDDDVVEGDDGVLRKYFGNETEISLLKFGSALSQRYGSFRQMRDQYRPHRVALFPFDPVHKWTAVLIRVDAPLDPSFFDVGNRSSASSDSSDEGRKPLKGDEAYRLYVKGAAEVLLGYCTHIVDGSGEVRDITDFQDKLRKVIAAWTRAGRRVITLAYKDIGYRPPCDVTDEDVSDMVCLGVVGIRDSIIPTVKNNIRKAQSAGVKVRLVTGENLERAITLARRVNIYNPEYHEAMATEQYNSLTNDEMKAYLPNLTILARATPDDKERLIKQLQTDADAIVAVTGGNLSDRRSLIAADVGFAMGQSGTGVARGVADIILLSDNFGSVVTTIKWGRNVFYSVRKFLQFQLTCNIVTVVIVIVGSVVNSRGESPISPVSLLWVNLIMDTLAAIALSSDPPAPSLLRRTKPVSSKESVITRVMMMHILGQAAYQILMLLLVLFIGPAFYSVDRYDRKHFTILFTGHVLMSLCNFFNVRSVFQQHNVVSGLERNYFFWAVFLGSGGIQAVIVTLGGSWTKTEPIGPLQWVSCLVMGAGSLIVGAWLRGIPVKGVLLESKDIHDSAKERAEWRLTLTRRPMAEKVRIAFRVG